MKTRSRIALLGYQALLLFLLPVFLIRLGWRSRRQPAYREHWWERLALYPRNNPNTQGCIWIHAVSVGETRACVPLVAAIRERWPDRSILMTHTTPTGREVGENLYGDQVTRLYLPYDIPGAIDRFLRRFQPSIGLMMETEIWPGIVHSAGRHHIPVCLISGRLSERSARAYAKTGLLGRDAFSGMSLICAQTEADAERFRQRGANRVVVTGNLKFDAPLADNETSQGQRVRAWLGEHRPVFLAASTREGEEALILEAWKKTRLHPSRPLLVLVPRHPQRFNEVATLIHDAGDPYVRKTEMPLCAESNALAFPSDQILSDSVNVVLGDTMGEMAIWYRAADLAFIGGSLLPLGGQNLIEALARACPVLIGLHTFNFNQVTQEALAAGAAVRVNTPDSLVDQAQELLKDSARRKQMGEAGQAFVARHQGSAHRTLDQLAPFVKS